MAADIKAEHIINVDLFRKGTIATVLLTADGKPEIKEANPRFKKDIQSILDDIGDSLLPIQIDPLEETDDRKRKISCQVRYCSPGEIDYEYALAYAITRHKLPDGRTIRSTVKTEKG